jgi:hypothetical protein
MAHQYVLKVWKLEQVERMHAELGMVEGTKHCYYPACEEGERKLYLDS